MESDRGLVLKLGQKVRAALEDPEVVKLTNMYLSAEEYDVLAALPAAEIRKTRWRAVWNGIIVSIDEFDGRLQGLLLAEIGLGSHEVHRPAPPFAVRDVTNDDRFSGGALAFASADAIHVLLQEVGVVAAE